MNERIKEIRKDLGMTLEKFGEPIGLKKSALSLLESGRNALTDRTIKDICRVYNVNEEWLRTGEGEMYLPLDREEEIAKLTVGLFLEESDSFKNRFISMLARMTDDEWALLESMVDKLKKE